MSIQECKPVEQNDDNNYDLIKNTIKSSLGGVVVVLDIVMIVVTKVVSVGVVMVVVGMQRKYAVMETVVLVMEIGLVRVAVFGR